EGQGLARTGAAAAEHVAAGEGVRNGRGLDRERAGHTVVRQLLDDLLGEPEVTEARAGGNVRQVTFTFLVESAAFRGRPRGTGPQRRDRTNAPDHAARGAVRPPRRRAARRAGCAQRRSAARRRVLDQLSGSPGTLDSPR